MTELVSIMLPTFARCAGGYLERAIGSVLAQSHREFELIVVDDGSSDGSANLIRRYARTDSRVRHVRHERNIGLPALSLGLSYPQASGAYLCFIFDDCTIVPHHFERLLDALRTQPDAIMAYGQAAATWMNGGTLIIGKAYNAAEMQCGHNHVPNVGVMLRRTAIDLHGWYDPHVLLKRFCDWDLWTRIAADRPPVFVPEILAHEEGTKLRDSLGERVTVFRDLMLRYSRTDRTAALRPEDLQLYDPFRADILPSLSPQDRADLDYLVAEHLLAVGDETAMLARFGRHFEGSRETKLASIRAWYLQRRVEILGDERNEFQHAWLSASSRQAELLAEASAADELARAGERHEAEKAALEAAIEDETARRIEAEAQLMELAQASDEAMRSLAELEQRLNAEKEYSARVATLHHHVLTSTSWRITRPLRGLMRLARWKPWSAGTSQALPKADPRPPIRPAEDADQGADAASSDLQAEAERSRSVPDGAVGSRRMRIIGIADAIASTEVCLRLPLDYMARHLDVSYAIYEQGSLPPRNVWMGADILLFMRSVSAECVHLAQEARREGIAVVYMTDDDMDCLLESEPGSPEIATLIESLREIDALGNIREIAAASDMAIVFSASLQARFSALTRTHLVPAAAGAELYEALPEAARPEPERAEIRIGFAGSRSHGRNVALVVPALKALLDKHAPWLVVESIGQPIEGLLDHPGYRHFEHVSGLSAYSVLQRARSWDIGLAPLEITPFNEAKSDNKFRSYAAAGIPGVYTRIAPFDAAIRDGHTGLLVDNDDAEWTAAIERLIVDRSLRQRIAQAALEEIRDRFGLERIALLYRRLFAEAVSSVKMLVVDDRRRTPSQAARQIDLEALRRRGVVRTRLRDAAAVGDVDLEWADVLIGSADEPQPAELVRRADAHGIEVLHAWDELERFGERPRRAEAGGASSNVMASEQ